VGWHRREAGSAVAESVNDDRLAASRYAAQLTIAENEVRRLAKRLASIDPVWSSGAYARTLAALLVERERLRHLRTTGERASSGGECDATL
jgi:hypothetical protein